MKKETDTAIMNKLLTIDVDNIEGIDVIQLVSSLPSPLCKPYDQADLDVPHISIERMKPQKNLIRQRFGEEYTLFNDGENIVTVSYPEPRIITYQIETFCRSPQDDDYLTDELERTLGEGGELTANFTVGGYSVEETLFYLLVEMDEEKESHPEVVFRAIYRYEIETWLFPNVAPFTSKLVEKRISDVLNKPTDTEVYIEVDHDPD